MQTLNGLFTLFTKNLKKPQLPLILMKVSVVLATYNERDNIVRLVPALVDDFKAHKLDYEIIVVDDRSPDGTAEAAKKEFSKNRKVKVIVRTERGLATALRRGIEESNGDVVVLMDTDFSHSPVQVSALASLAAKSGIASGSRFMRGGRFVAKAYRSLGTRIVQLFARIVLGVPCSDFTNGFVAVRRDALRRLDFRRIFFGYGDYCFRLFYYLHRAGYKVAEIPSIYKPRVHGASKTRELSTGFGYLLEILKLRFRG